MIPAVVAMNIGNDPQDKEQQLADRVGVSKSIISFYELKDRSPSPEVLVKLSYIFHVSTDYLLGIQRNKTIDVSGLDDEDIKAVQMVVDTLKKKK